MTTINAEKIPLSIRLTGNVWMVTLPSRWMNLDTEGSSNGNSLFYFSDEDGNEVCVAVQNSGLTTKLFVEIEKDQVVFTEYEYARQNL